MSELFLGAIVTAGLSPVWYTVIYYPKPGGVASVVSTTGIYTTTKKMDFQTVPLTLLHRLESDVAIQLGCNLRQQESESGTLSKAYCECNGRHDLTKHPPGPHSDDLFAGRIKEYMTNSQYSGQILEAVTNVTCSVTTSYIPSKDCWATKIDNMIAYGSLASSVAMAYLAWKGVGYMKGRIKITSALAEKEKDKHGTDNIR